MTNQEFYDKAIEAIDELFSDTSVSQEECLANLRGLTDEINNKISCIKADMKREASQ